MMDFNKTNGETESNTEVIATEESENEITETISDETTETVLDENTDVQQQESQKRPFKKIVICAVAIAVAAILVIFGGIKFYDFVIKSYPILPDEIQMGMNLDEFMEIFPTVVKNSEEVTYDVVEKTYSVTCEIASGSPQELFEELYKITPYTVCNAYFNKNKELCEIYISSNMKEKGRETAEEYLNYFSKSIHSKISWNSEDDIVASTYFKTDDGMEVKIDAIGETIHITIRSEEYAPNIPEISSTVINDTFDSLNYIVSGFWKINLRKLINACVTNQELSYLSYRGSRTYIDSEKREKLENSEFAEYLSTSYVVTVHGDVCANPDIQYYLTEDIDAIKLLILFDEDGNYKGYYTLEESSEFNTFAILYVASY